MDDIAGARTLLTRASAGRIQILQRLSPAALQSARDPYASASHFFRKLALAAPASGLPSALTALSAHASVLHFLTKLVLAAPASGLPSFPTALLSQVSSANADPMAKSEKTTARTMR